MTDDDDILQMLGVGRTKAEVWDDTLFDLRYLMACAEKTEARVTELEAERDALKARVAELEAAAHMPPGWNFGMAAWINQRLYAAYIGAIFSDMVMEQIRTGRQTFPDSPTHRRMVAAEARVAELEAQLAAQGWRPVTEKPEPDQEVEIVIEATFDDYGPGGWTSYGYYFAADYPTGWRPLPPAPQEPTR